MTTFAIPTNSGLDLYTYDGTSFTRRQRIPAITRATATISNWNNTGFLSEYFNEWYAVHISASSGVSVVRFTAATSDNASRGIVLNGGTINADNQLTGPLQLVYVSVSRRDYYIDVYPSPTVSGGNITREGRRAARISLGRSVEELAGKTIDWAGPGRFIAYNSSTQTFTGYFTGTGNRITDAELNVLPTFSPDSTFLDNITGWWHDGEYIYRSNGTDIRRWAWQLI